MKPNPATIRSESWFSRIKAEQELALPVFRWGGGAAV